MASSSPISPAHEFCEYINKARLENTYHSYTINEGEYNDDLIKEFCDEAGGKESTTWRREYLNEIIIDDDYAIIPEAQKFVPGISYSNDRKWFHNYVSMDIGIRDLTVLLFGFYDFKRAKLCIEREFVINGPQMTTPKVAEAGKRIELDIFGNTKGEIKRISDNNNLLLLQDLGYLHNYHFIPTSKDSLEAMVNEMRILFKQNRIEIDPSCKLLLESISFGFWNDQRSDFGRSNSLGHFDAIAALMYMIRNIDQTTNPVPVKVGFDDYYIPEENPSVHELQKLISF